MMERLEFPLGLVRALSVHIPLLLHLPDLPSALDKTDDALVADKDEDDREHQQGDHIFAPFGKFTICPKLRKSHNIFKIGDKVTLFFAYIKIFL